ncbi:MAG: hypothetical protein A2V70_02780 [Planctomycetes bacterium RBG_13_63_9]|nr:MAG: hypothetical protein A2V70_02780 [Planctomycetes bacterium RBG_13_63_9]
MPTDPLVFSTQEDERRVVEGAERRVAITLEWDEIDLGFQLYLDRFEKRLVSGSSQASHYSSWVDLLDPKEPGKRLKGDVEITLNAPVDFWDRGSGRSYRLYQSSYRPPLRPGDPGFDKLAGGTGRDYFFLSWLTVNYDPGRGVKYAGCLLIVIGITIMFYMKAYFFRPRGAKKKGALQREESLGLEGKVAGRETP